MRLRLETTLDEFDAIHASITARAKHVQVAVGTISHMLVDHSRMVRMLGELGVKEEITPAPAPPMRSRRGGAA